MTDSDYWPDAPVHKAAYLHKLCVRRTFAGMGITKIIFAAIKEECLKRGPLSQRKSNGTL